MHALHAIPWISTAAPVFPDETVGSIAARHHLLSGPVAAYRTLVNLFGTKGIRPNSSLPTHLLIFMKAYFGTDSFEAVRQFIDGHTLKPYFCFAGSARQAETIVRQMAGPNGVKSHLGLPAGRLGASDQLRYCQECAEQDIERYGISYWHRAHQLPLVSVCHLHGTYLGTVKGTAEALHKHALPLPPQVAQMFATSKDKPQIIPALPLQQRQRQFAILSYEMLTRNGNYSPLRLREIYQWRLIEMELAKHSGRVDQRALASELCRHHANFDFLPQPARFLRKADGALPWVERMVRSPRTRQHPVFHLLLIDFLFGNWSGFARYSLSSRTVARPVPAPKRDASVQRQLEIPVATIRFAG